MTLLLIAAGLALALVNGANDNFKGFATVWGSRALDYRTTLKWASVATAAGGLASIVLAEGLVRQFSGRGIVPEHVVADPRFAGAVVGAAAATVLAATRLGLPISTTHALIGGLLGAGLAAGEVNLGALSGGFVVPLLVSPLLSAALAFAAYALAPAQSTADSCLCVTSGEPDAPGAAAAAQGARVVVASDAECDRLPAPASRISLAALRDGAHIASATAVCFARGVNDAPKLAAVLVAAHGLGAAGAAALVTAAMVAGGLLFSRRVAETMSHRINRIDATQALSANLVTSALVLAASMLSLPVSTTHVSVGSIAGAGARARTADWTALRGVLLAWLATLPLAAACAWLIYRSASG